MSTNPRQSTESQTTATRPLADASDADVTPAEETPATTPDDADSWVDRCQRQFDAHRTNRLRNLADEANAVLP